MVLSRWLVWPGPLQPSLISVSRSCRQASLRGLAWRCCLPAFAVVVATDFEGVAQFVEVLLGGGLLPLVQEVG
jgi:hypothetical protein